MAMGFMVFYLSFFVTVGFLGFMGAEFIEGDDPTNLPTLPTDPGLFDALTYAVHWVGYILGLGGLTITGIPTIVSVGIATILHGTMIYVVTRLIRGGG